MSSSTRGSSHLVAVAEELRCGRVAERLHIRNSVEELAVVLDFVRADRKLVEEQLKRLRARTAKKGGLSALLSGFDLGSTVAAEAAPLGALAVAVDP